MLVGTTTIGRGGCRNTSGYKYVFQKYTYFVVFFLCSTKDKGAFRKRQRAKPESEKSERSSLRVLPLNKSSDADIISEERNYRRFHFKYAVRLSVCLSIVADSDNDGIILLHVYAS